MRAVSVLALAGCLTACTPPDSTGQLDDELPVKGATTSYGGGDVTPPTAPFHAPTLSVSPAAGTPGTLVTLTGNYFQPGVWTQLQLGGASSSALPDRNGHLLASINVPLLGGGSAIISAITSGGVVAHANFLVLSHGTVTVPDLIPGAAQSITGSGFVPGRALLVTVTDPDLHTRSSSSPVADAQGNFSLPITIDYGDMVGTWNVQVLDAAAQEWLCAASFFVRRPLSAHVYQGNVIFTGSGFYPGDLFYAYLKDPAVTASPFGSAFTWGGEPAAIDANGNLTATVPLPPDPTAGIWGAAVLTTPDSDSQMTTFTIQ